MQKKVKTACCLGNTHSYICWKAKMIRIKRANFQKADNKEFILASAMWKGKVMCMFWARKLKRKTWLAERGVQRHCIRYQFPMRMQKATSGKAWCGHLIGSSFKSATAVELSAALLALLSWCMSCPGGCIYSPVHAYAVLVHACAVLVRACHWARR